MSSQANAPVTDASASPGKNPVGAPQRPLTNVPSITLAAVGGNGEPGEAFFETAGKGVAVRIVSRAVEPGVTMPAEIAHRGCGANGSRAYALQPVKGGASITTLPNVSVQRLETGDLSVRVSRKGKVIQCGAIVAPKEPTR